MEIWNLPFTCKTGLIESACYKPACIFFHMFVWGSCFWLCTPACLLLTHNLFAHHLLAHNFLKHNCGTHTHTHNLALSGRRGSRGHPPPFCAAIIALGDVDLCFVWQTWHLVTSTSTLPSRFGSCGAWMALVARLVPTDAVPLCAAGGALGDINFHCVWQAWHLVTLPSLCVACLGLPVHNHTCTHTDVQTVISHTGLSYIALIISYLCNCLSHAVFTFLLWFIGGNWHVALSGPIICQKPFHVEARTRGNKSSLSVSAGPV